MFAQTDVSMLDRVTRAVDHRLGACSHERSVEAEVLLQAITALRHEDILTAAEYEAKRQRLAAHL